MTTQRFLVMGDNHGNTESLERVADDTEREQFDFVVHVGDFTNADKDGKEAGVEQLQAAEPILKTIVERAEHGLLYVYGNRDYYGDLAYDLDVGTHIPPNEYVVVGGQRFTQEVDAVESGDILVTHREVSAMIDHFEGRAYFCGHTHIGRYKDRMLNSAFLHRDNYRTNDSMYGGYFVVEVPDEPPFDVDLRDFGRFDTIICQQHHERGVLIGPDYHNCMYCWQPIKVMRELARSAFYGVTNDAGRSYATDDELVKYAVELWDSSPAGFEQEFREYLSPETVDPKDPLARDDDGRLVKAYANIEL